MIKIKLFSVKKNKYIEGGEAELYCNLYLILNKTSIFTFLIESPDHAFSNRHLVRLIKTWIMQAEEDNVKWLRRAESEMRDIHLLNDHLTKAEIIKRETVLVQNKVSIDSREIEAIEEIKGELSREIGESLYANGLISFETSNENCWINLTARVRVVKN